MGRLFPRLLAPCALALFAGCVATQRDILDLSQQNDTIQLQVQGLKKLMTQIEANQADLNSRLDDMRRDMTVLNESLKDNHDSTSRLSSKMDDLGAAIGMKVSSLQKGLDETQKTIQATEERRRAEAAETAKKTAEEQARLQAEADKAKAAAAAATAAANAAKPSEIFQDARKQYDKGAYDLSAQGFQLYIDQFPKGETADLAGYYLGQSLFAQEKWEAAARAYAGVLDRFPQSDVTAASRLRYAQSILRLGGHDDEAKRYLESIPQDFAKTPEAVKAKEILKSLKKKKKASDQDR